MKHLFGLSNLVALTDAAAHLRNSLSITSDWLITLASYSLLRAGFPSYLRFLGMNHVFEFKLALLKVTLPRWIDDQEFIGVWGISKLVFMARA